jgi:hypothetical protein
MSEIELRGPNPRDRSDWNHAWKVVSELAAARGTTLRQVGADDRRGSGPDVTPHPSPGSPSTPAAPFASTAPDQLARDIAEIERAAAALRRAEPTLEQRTAEPETSSEPRPSRSIWPLVCVVWLTAVLVVSSTIGAIVLLFG